MRFVRATRLRVVAFRSLVLAGKSAFVIAVCTLSGWLALTSVGCSATHERAPSDAGALADGSSERDGGDASTIPVDFTDAPIDGLSSDDAKRFNIADALFARRYFEADGLGPLFARVSCSSCHADAARGPGLVQKMAVVEDDGQTPALDQSKLAFGFSVIPQLAAGATMAILPPQNDKTIKVTVRIGPPVIGHGYLEAVDDKEIERIAAEQAVSTGIVHGRVNRVAYAAELSADSAYHVHKKGDAHLIGRFGMKARSATLDDFIAGALLGDIGITSPMRPTEPLNPDGLTDDRKAGIDVSTETVRELSFYVRHLAIPARTNLPPTGPALFSQMGCAVCHVPSLKTRADYPVRQLAGIDAPVFTDFLLHDMGTDLADGIPSGTLDGQAGPRDWRTGPLIGMRFMKSFMHDGRATTVEESILMHGGPGSEAQPCVEHFSQLSDADRKTLVTYVERL